MARQLIISIIFFGFFGVAAGQASADDIGVGTPSNSTTSTSTSSASTDDDIGVGEESWFELFIQSFESTDETDS